MANDPASRTRQFRDALYDSLTGADAAVRDTSPVVVLSRLVQRAMPSAANVPAALGVLDALAAFSSAREPDEALSIAETEFATPARFLDAIFFARCLVREPASALALLTARRYLEGATVPAAFPDLLTDRAAVLDATTFAALWREPGRIEWALNSLGLWRRDYVATYLPEHAAYNRALSTIAEEVDGQTAQVAAVERLNGLRRLGPALASSALLQFHDLERLFACPLDTEGMNEALTPTPVCPQCSYRLGDRAPAADARRVRQAIERALATQQTRLAQRVVSRLLVRPVAGDEERLSRFIQVVQASDLAGLALVLDDTLVDFLRDLLETQDPRSDVLDRLAGAFPEVTPANLDAAVQEFRRLLEADLARSGRLRLSNAERDT